MNSSDNQRTRRGVSLLSASLCGAIAVLMVAGGPSSAASMRGVEVVPAGKTLFRKSYNELTGEWSNWLQKEPIATSPAFDTDGRFCDLNQKGKIWFLAGTFEDVEDRSCEVPAGKGVFFPIFSFISFAPEFLDMPPCNAGEEVDQIRCDASLIPDRMPDVALDVTIDGKPVPDLFAYRVQSEPSGFTLALGPLFEDFGFDPGDRFPAVVDGFWILLEPLPPGYHTVSFSAVSTDGSVDLGANYDLVVPRIGSR